MKAAHKIMFFGWRGWSVDLEGGGGGGVRKRDLRGFHK